MLFRSVDYMKIYKMDYERENVLITNGGAEAITMVFSAVLNPGDEAIAAEPFYANYTTFCSQADGKLVPIVSNAEKGYFWAEKGNIEASITSKTKAICCISPGNPTGRVLSLDEMRIVADVAKKHDLWIIADEIYREFAYDRRQIGRASCRERV